MGREIKRVPLDFDAPLDETWAPLLMPKDLQALDCPSCSGDGMTVEARAVAETFYPHQIGGFGSDRAEALAWCDKIGQAEVDHLVDKGRLAVGSSAAQVNAANRRGGGFGGHDAINRWYLVSFRCERLGIEERCPTCNGEGSAWRDAAHKAAHDAWEPAQVPTGEGWQVWQTVSEGGPVSPVFPTAAALVDWLVEGGDLWDRKRGHGGWRREAAEAFVGNGWAPSFIGTRATGVVDAARNADVVMGSPAL